MSLPSDAIMHSSMDMDSDYDSDYLGETDKLHTELSERKHDNLHLGDLMLTYILEAKVKTISPPLPESCEFHVFFLYHPNDRSWVLNVMERLEIATLGFRCCCLERDFEPKTTLTSKANYGIKNSLKTVIVLSSDFLSDTWNSTESPLISDVDLLLIHRKLLVVLLQECDVPSVLSELCYIDACEEHDDWWPRLLSQLVSTPLTQEHCTTAPNNGTLLGLNPNLQSGHLLVSLKSRCRCCGKEVIEPHCVPDDFMAHGIHIPVEEYEEAVLHLMADSKFLCHVWCYNVPAALLFFSLLLGLCLTVIPIIETEYIFHQKETGLEYLHAGIVWLCVLTAYMIIIHISKKKAFLQELMMKIEEASNCLYNQTVESGDVTIEMQDDDVTNNDQSRVLECANITNASLQIQAEDLIIQHSGEYVSLLITKKLDRPRKSRHVTDHPCLCQFVEHRVYKNSPL